MQKGESNDHFFLQERDSIINGPPTTVLPRGTILMIGTTEIDHWFNMTGAGLGEYQGWYLCDGRNGTPALNGKFLGNYLVLKVF